MVFADIGKENADNFLNTILAVICMVSDRPTTGLNEENIKQLIKNISNVMMDRATVNELSDHRNTLLTDDVQRFRCMLLWLLGTAREGMKLQQRTLEKQSVKMGMV